MYHYLFTNDLRISNLSEMLQKTAHAFVTDTIPSATENKSENNNMMTLGFYFNLYKETKCAKVASSGNIRSVVLNFIRKYQFPNPRTSESLADCVNDGITLAPMRIILQLLYFLRILHPGADRLSREEILNFIFYNSDVAKTKNPNIFNLMDQIIDYRKNGILPSTIDCDINNRNWNQEDRQIREMTKVLTWSGCVSENENHELFINHDLLTEENKAALFDTLNYSGYWIPDPSKTFEENKLSYISYMDIYETDITSTLSINKTAHQLGGYNEIYYGAPGCGKSKFISNELARVGTDKKNIIRVTFHPEYANCDFIGQILPTVETKVDKATGEKKDIVKYIFNPGPFTLALEKAMNTEVPVYLIVEEINRGNAAAIFGDMFQLLDREKPYRSDGTDNPLYGQSEYPVCNPNMQKYLMDKVEDEYSLKMLEDGVFIPSNLTILATMNSSDQNVFTLDTAFKRRWNFDMISNDIKKDEDHKFKHWYVPGTSVTWETFLDKVNDKILDQKIHSQTNEDKRLGKYFVTRECLTETPVSIKDAEDAGNAFAYKILEYIWNDVCKIGREDWFDTATYKTLEDLIAEFMNPANANPLVVFQNITF